MPWRWLIIILLAAAPAVSQTLGDVRRQIDAGQLAEAEQSLGQILAAESPAGEAHFLLGIVQFRSGRLPEAARTFGGIVQDSPKNWEAWKYLGMAYSAMGAFDQADQPFRRACDLKPEDEGACYYLGRNAYVLTQFDASIAAFQKALAAGHNTARVHRGLGLSFEAVGDVEQAVKHLRTAVRLSGRETRADVDPRIDLGVVLFRRGDPDEAIPYLEAAVKDHPTFSRAHYQLGRCYYQLRQDEQAAAHLEQAVRHDSRNWPAHLLLGKTYIRLGRAEEGKKHSLIGSRGAVAQSSGSSSVR